MNEQPIDEHIWKVNRTSELKQGNLCALVIPRTI